MKHSMRTVLLVGALVVVAALVILDRAAPAGDGDASAGAASRYVQEASLNADLEAALATEEAWEAASADATEAFSRIADRLLVAESEDIAFARLREIVQANMADLGLTDGATSALRAETPLAGESLRVVGLRLEFTTNDPALAYRLVDRLEHLPDVAANVGAMTIVGPGRLGRKRATVTLEVRAMAWMGRGA